MRTAFWPVLAALALCCSSPSETLGGETNWLRICAADGDCPNQHSCACGICAKPCEASRCPPGQQCQMSASNWDQACPAPPSAGLCVPACSQSCITGFECRDGACLPKEVPAFRGAEGFGARASGGRGGAVIRVTSLAAEGPGSLQAALDAPGPRTIVFAVSGVIPADIVITHGDVTVAGQTAPGAGITIAGRVVSPYEVAISNVILRHIRIRPPSTGISPTEATQHDALRFERGSRIMVDHVSAAFAVDEIMDFFQSSEVTVQWCTLESSSSVGHPEGPHNYGLSNGPEGARLTVHHTLFSHHLSDAPSLSGGPAESINNTIYDVRSAFSHRNPARGIFSIIGNTFRVGPSAELIPFYFDDERAVAEESLGYYLMDNWVDGSPATCPEGLLADPWLACTNDLGRSRAFLRTSSADFGEYPIYRPVTTESAAIAYQRVLRSAGAFPRDVVTRQNVTDVETRSGVLGAWTPSDLLEGLTVTQPPEDSDKDGIANAWEVLHGMDPNNARDYANRMDSGWTALEVYLDELAEQLIAQ